jgi:DNA-nicking Smr family endonuclease
LLAGLEQARAAGQRCILIIHGAGLHSQDGPVLRSAVPDWLLTGPMAGEVLALAGAPPALGGAGASLVLLRRAR